MLTELIKFAIWQKPLAYLQRQQAGFVSIVKKPDDSDRVILCYCYFQLARKNIKIRNEFAEWKECERLE